MATSPSSPSPEEVAAVMAALHVVLGREVPLEQAAPAWRWSGRRWQWPESWTGSEPAPR